MSSRPRNWIKLWVSWLTTPAHLDLSEGAFGLGPLLLLLCTWDGTYEGGGWLLAEDGTPLTATSLMRATHRGSIGRLNSQLAELFKCGTLKRREDGAIGFPKFGRWQESKSARSNRKARAVRKDRNVHSEVHNERDVNDRRRDEETTDGSPLRSEPSIAPLAGSSPPSPPAADVVSPAEPTGGQVLTHPTAEAGAGRQATQRRRAAAELWAWHEGERVRRLCGHATPPRKHTDRDIDAIVRLHAHVRKRCACSEADAWGHVREFRERALADAEEALRTERQAYPSKGQQLLWARTGAAWSVKAYDLLAEREPDQKAAQAQADEAYRAEVRRMKAEKAAQQQGGGA